MVAAHTDNLAEDFGADVRNIMSTPQYKQVFPEVAFQRGGNAKNRLQTTKGGLAFFVGRGTALIGRGADFLILDDLIKNAEEARSAAVREEVWEWVVKVAMTRRMSARSPVVIIMQRWHEDDPVGRITDPTNPKARPDLGLKVQDHRSAGARGGRRSARPAEGQALWPLSKGQPKFDEEFPGAAAAPRSDRLPRALPAAAVRRGRDAVPARQHPPLRPRRPAGEPDALLHVGPRVGEDRKKHDASVLLGGGLDRGNNLWLTNCIWERWATDRIVEAMLDMAQELNPLIWAAERGHISKSIGPFLRKRMHERNIFFPLREITPSENKEVRAQAIAGRVAQGKVFFPRHAAWTERAIDELLKFPNGRNDDFVDALAYFGILLQSMFAPGRSEQERRAAEPKTGSYAWIKAMQKRQEQAERFREGGGY